MALVHHGRRSHLGGGRHILPYCDESRMYGHSILASKGSYIQDNETAEPERLIGYGAFGVVWAVTDPRTKKQVALKKLLNVFQSLVSCRRVYRELKMLCSLKHDNVLSASDIMPPPHIDLFSEVYVVTELMQSDLHKIIVSHQPLSIDHIKVFTYQILRGLKYLHSANILHRDIKPGNLLVNADCCLKICDFGLARVDEPNESIKLTQEVVTQYYRAPEILMGARHYTSAIDVWSVGCIVAELLSHRVLFQAHSPIQQLDHILELLGTPSLDDMKGMCEPAKQHVLCKAPQQSHLSALYKLSPDADDAIVHLMLQMLVFNPEKRISAAAALCHPYLEDGRTRYHACMCTCCYRSENGVINLTRDMEPVCMEPFSFRFEDELCSVSHIRDKLYHLCLNAASSYGAPLYINYNSPVYKKFANSQCAQVSELPPSPHVWE